MAVVEEQALPLVELVGLDAHLFDLERTTDVLPQQLGIGCQVRIVANDPAGVLPPAHDMDLQDLAESGSEVHGLERL